MRRHWSTLLVIRSALMILLLSSFSLSAFAAQSKQETKKKRVAQAKQKKTRRLASSTEASPPKVKKAITNDEWITIIGPRISEKYTILKGDTLADISKRLFGDIKYYPKIWALNNNQITNPHRIFPGINMLFEPGKSGPSLLSGTMVAENSSGTKARSTDWKYLPRQAWESYQPPKSIQVDPSGIDNIKVKFHEPTGFDPQAIPSGEKLFFLGQIVGSRSEGDYLGMNDTVYIRADDGVEIGATYAITQAPWLLKSSKSDRVGYSYQILGKVKILGVRDQLFVGTITSAKDFISRGNSLIPLPPRIPPMPPIPAPRAVKGILMVDRNLSTYVVAQHKEVYIDRGKDDGVQPGMIFRAYQHRDPSNDKRLTRSDFIIDADIQVTQVCDTFSSGLVLESKNLVAENSEVVLLTDISDLVRNKGFRERGEKEGDLNELDGLDEQDTLGPNEKKELKQLEKWKTNPDGTEGSGKELDAVATPVEENSNSNEAVPLVATPPPTAPEAPPEPASTSDADSGDSEVPPPPEAAAESAPAPDSEDPPLPEPPMPTLDPGLPTTQ